MIAENFDTTAALAGAVCPRCRAVGLEPIDFDTLEQAREQNRHKARAYIDPSVPARCPACGLVGEWPGMSMNVDG